MEIKIEWTDVGELMTELKKLTQDAQVLINGHPEFILYDNNDGVVNIVPCTEDDQDDSDEDDWLDDEEEYDDDMLDTIENDQKVYGGGEDGEDDEDEIDDEEELIGDNDEAGGYGFNEGK